MRPDIADKESFLHFVPHDVEKQQITLSDIAQRLRLVHDEMKRRAPYGSVQNPVSVLEKTNDGLKSYLDDIARALLAEYGARRQSQEKLFARLDRIEQILEEKSRTQYSYRQSLLHDVVASVHVTLKQELVTQLRKLVANSQQNNKEITRQIREAVATSRFSAQLASLQQQIANIQATLSAHDEPQKNIAANFAPQQENEQRATLQFSASDARQKADIKIFDKPVIRILAEKKLAEPAQGLKAKPATVHESGQSDGNRKFDPRQSGEMIACARALNQQIHCEFAKKQS